MPFARGKTKLTGAPVCLVPCIFLPLLKLPLRTRLVIFATFAIGSLSMVSSVLRFALIYSASLHPHDGMNLAAMWSNVEIFAGSVAFLAPAFRGLFTRKNHRDLQQPQPLQPQLQPQVIQGRSRSFFKNPISSRVQQLHLQSSEDLEYGLSVELRSST